MWSDYENETLIHHHKMAKLYKKRYQRASSFHNSLYRFFGLITVISSTISSTITWNLKEEEKEGVLLIIISTSAAISASIQNFYKFQENSNHFMITAKEYASLQNKIERIGNINPNHREIDPHETFEMIQTIFHQISEKRKEISNCFIRLCYEKKDDSKSFLEDKYIKFKV